MLEKVSIYKFQLEEMHHRLEKLNLLERGGVDNWVYYWHTIRDWNIKDDHKEALAQVISDINDVLVDAEVDQPAGYGCGYSITFDEEAVAKFIQGYVKRYNEIESSKT